ncbi:FkbM family methyltransferase [Polymorphobacter fuscus]|uniref:FkbM family methyltransferase n=1 Tax=Sandarakinorhabdus fusca TaxID=1439888 RepID=A0A7C9KGQ7_9SPHN|nr:FkbM family methyltransferase [Polymorphobacter fuscus]KAB7648367.1 FkbM family methyltransferase [Polymorphobacter fuscus]MQT15881.1 FkbM family methyltransferase [Polymorphobacter fuscus]NJC07846.1 FkbM family methyltransferase [Polymorphobacter fuscus]
MDIDQEIKSLRKELAEVKEFARQTRGLVGPFGVPMPDGSMLTQTIHGLIYYIDPTDTIMAPQMMVYRQWEAELSSLIDMLLYDATTFVDVGANFGYFTCLGAKRLAGRPGASVLAIEPNPHLVKLLRRNSEINWSLAPIRVIEAAAGEEPGNVTLFVPHEHGANGGLTSRAKSDKHKVPMVKIDDIIDEGQSVDVMKIDVEGHELRVLKGAESVIGRSPNIKIIVEWSPGQMREAGISHTDVSDFMQKGGLTPFLARKTISEPISWEKLNNLGYDNILFQKSPEL